jgi:preprotein translocase subunit SecG
MSTASMNPVRIALLTVIAVCITVVTAVSLHSVKEIHYLKSFYPDRFSVSDAAAAAEVELIKVFLVALPLFLIVLVCLFLLLSSSKAEK